MATPSTRLMTFEEFEQLPSLSGSAMSSMTYALSGCGCCSKRPRERWDRVEDYVFGAPELVIEVLSPSNTASEMRDEHKLCLANGSFDFWVIDPEERAVKVSMPDGHRIIYGAGQQIPLFFADGSQITVDAIFE